MRRFGFYLALAFLLAGGCPGPETRQAPVAREQPTKPVDVEPPVAQADEPSEELIRKTLRGRGSPHLRVALIEQIETGQQAEFLPDLAALLSDSSKEVREAAARAIRSFGWERMSPPMFGVLRQSAAPIVARELACRTLVETGRREVVEPLIELLDEPQMRPVALAGLKDLTLHEFETSEDWRRWWAVNKNRTRVEWFQSAKGVLLARIAQLEKEAADSQGRVKKLEEELEAGRARSRELGARAADAIIKVLESRVDKKDPAPLIAALDESFVKVRKHAALELGKLQATEAVKRLSELAGGDGSSEVRIACASALGQIGTKESVPALARLLSDGNEEVAAAGARALGRVKDPSAVNRLLVALLNRSAVVRASAAEALGQIGSAAGVTPLIELLGSDREPRVREAAARALGEIGDKRAVAVLERALGDESPAIRAYAIEAIGALKATELAPKLCTLLEEDENPSVREAAAVTLGKAGGGESLPVLIKVLDHKDEKLVQLASSSIVGICKREEKLLEPTADTLVGVGHPEEAAKLYELLVQKLAEKKDEKRLISVRVKLADTYLAAKQWMKARPLLEELTQTLPDDVGLAEKRARTLTRLDKHVEALHVYQTLAARNETSGYWNERLALLEEMLKDKEAAEATKAVNEILGKEKDLPDDIKGKLAGIRRRGVEMVQAAERTRVEEIRRLIRELTSADADVQAGARTKLKERGAETYPYLVEALDRVDEKVRRTAVELLRELTKQNFGYRPEASLQKNVDAIRKWKVWIAAKRPG